MSGTPVGGDRDHDLDGVRLTALATGPATVAALVDVILRSGLVPGSATSIWA